MIQAEVQAQTASETVRLTKHWFWVEGSAAGPAEEGAGTLFRICVASSVLKTRGLCNFVIVGMYVVCSSCE